MLPSSRPTASILRRQLGWTAGVGIALLSLTAPAALAKKLDRHTGGIASRRHFNGPVADDL